MFQLNQPLVFINFVLFVFINMVSFQVIQHDKIKVVYHKVEDMCPRLQDTLHFVYYYQIPISWSATFHFFN